MKAVSLATMVICFAACVAAASDPVNSPQVGPSGRWNSAEGASRPAGGTSAAASAGVDIPLGGSNESTIAVNPLDPLNVVISSLFRYEVSNDAGLTWSPFQENTVPGVYGQCGDPTLAYDGSGRLFYGYLGCLGNGGCDVFVAELHPTTGAYLAGPFTASTSGFSGPCNDKAWLAADPSTTGPFAGNLYLAWTEFGAGTRVLFSRSVDHGAHWSTPQALSTVFDGFPWPTHVAVAPNGDVYVGYHSQPGFFCNTDGTSGNIVVLRSTDGGVTFPQRSLAFPPGEADITFNVQHCGDGVIPNTDFWMQGSGQPWILPDPLSPGTVYVVANDDPDNAHASGDDGNVYIVRSDDSGMTWGTPSRVDHGPGDSLQVYPTAAIDRLTRCIAVMWYDTRAGAQNVVGNYFLDVFYTLSHDGGVSFDPDVQINDVRFNPDLGAPSRFDGPPPTLRIGEYIGVAMGGTQASADLHGVWTGNSAFTQQAITDTAFSACVVSGVFPPSIVWDANPLSAARASRTVTMSLTAVGESGVAAIQIELFDLQHPNPRNRPANAPPNFTAFDTTNNGVCSGAATSPNYNGHHCDSDADCECTAPACGPSTPVAADDGFCGPAFVGCGVADGCVRWVGPVTTFREKQGVLSLGTYKAARLQCTPYYTDWTAVGPFSVFGAEILPSSSYRARSFASDCEFNEATCTNVSPAVTMLTRRSGDVASPWNPPDTGDQPTGGDVGEVLNKFKGSPGSPSNIAALIFGNAPDPNTDVGGQEIGETVNAFKGQAYPFSGPCECPSAVTCGATACSSTDTAPCGAGLCVITCVGGDNDGLPCRDFPPNTPADHCPGGFCPTNGFCRDRCGRCSQ